MNPEPGYSDKKNVFGKQEREIRDKKIASAKKAQETFRKLKEKRKKK